MNILLFRHHCANTALAAGLFSIALNGHAAPFFEFTATSQPGDFIGAGQSYFRNQHFGAASENALDLTGDGQIDFLDTFILGNIPGQFMDITIGTNQLGQNLVPGVYANAQRAAFAGAGHPGLDITLDGRGCNTVTGSFVLHDIAFVTANVLDRLDVEFEQHCEGATPALIGRFRYDRSRPLAPLVANVPALQPLGLVLLIAFLLALAGTQFRAASCGRRTRVSRPRDS